jgi:hypothetical protein
MPFGSGCMRGLIGQTEQVLTERCAQSQQTGCPRIQDGGSHSLAGSMDGPRQNDAAHHRSNGTIRILVDGQCGGLCHEVPSRRIKFSRFEQRLELIFVQRQPSRKGAGASCNKCAAWRSEASTLPSSPRAIFSIRRNQRAGASGSISSVIAFPLRRMRPPAMRRGAFCADARFCSIEFHQASSFEPLFSDRHSESRLNRNPRASAWNPPHSSSRWSVVGQCQSKKWLSDPHPSVTRLRARPLPEQSPRTRGRGGFWVRYPANASARASIPACLRG